MRRLPLKGLTAVLHGYADQHIAAVTSMVHLGRDDERIDRRGESEGAVRGTVWPLQRRAGAV